MTYSGISCSTYIGYSYSLLARSARFCGTHSESALYTLKNGFRLCSTDVKIYHYTRQRVVVKNYLLNVFFILFFFIKLQLFIFEFTLFIASIYSMSARLLSSFSPSIAHSLFLFGEISLNYCFAEQNLLGK